MNEQKSWLEWKKRSFLEGRFRELVASIGPIPIASTRIMPYGWRKAAKGRTVWRIVEEVVSQNIEKNASELGFDYIEPAESEVGVWDFRFSYNSRPESFVNIKSAIAGGRRNKDDLSKAEKLVQFYEQNAQANLYIATFVLEFSNDMTVKICDAICFPIAWIPDIYVNPSNNGNLQSAYYKELDRAVRRTNSEFLEEFYQEIEVANEKRRAKAMK